MTEVKLVKNKIKKLSTREELKTFSNEALIDRVLQLEAHNLQLKNIITKHMHDDNIPNSNCPKSGKGFDFSKSHKRHILLKFYYLGWDYQGFATQEDTINTIEQHVFAALKKSCLIQNREDSNYHRCGRTDKGVSAFSQVISLDVRSKLSQENKNNLQEELPYCKILNRLLPQNIRCVCWSPAAADFSARFNCKQRQYKYFFPRGNLNINDMNTAVRYTIGTHDFRNICKMDVANGVVSFVRAISAAEISLYSKDSEQVETSGYDMCQLTLTGQAFLWHQIRCLMGILLLVGQGKEKPEVILELLNVEKYPRKPQYSMASEIPLNLFRTDFEITEWIFDQDELAQVIKTLQSDWALNTIKSAMTREMLTDMQAKLTNAEKLNFQSDCLLTGVKSKVYQPLLQRTTCEPLENRIDHYVKKRRLEVKQYEPVDGSISEDSESSMKYC
ncbi:tRNA pseudouridine(38/39) synthase [Neodiprion pinetum]|uniref:tRNA pseudouridine(38/39) synthase n=1 Tax=Neodiprion pinetum TaxID=441929 RepID=UPI001EDD2D7E|nr:tRNA pseudouridine(38/39) synthase [Neodiprion pinetum]